MYLIGYDLGSSSIKAALIRTSDRVVVGVVHYPEREMEMLSLFPGWAEQDPEDWWKNLCIATQKLLKQTGVDARAIQAIGIAYQMHGLVLVDKQQQVLRPAIIWCDSRAVSIGNTAWAEIGEEYCLKHYLNSPGNFTAAKLRWVKENEPHLYERIHKAMLPGDYIAMRLTGDICTTVSGLSEGVFWDFREHGLASELLHYFGFESSVLPRIADTCSVQGLITPVAAEASGLPAGIPVTYRAGDQPNNALSLNVLEAGEVAATGGTSGVVYGVVDELLYDPQSRVNGFAHVNHSQDDPRLGILLCINGAGSQYSWIKHQIASEGLSYQEMEQEAATITPGAEGLRILPFGNGAERMLGNAAPGATIHNLQFNRHRRAHLYRAGLEGIAFSFVYGMRILQELGLDVRVIRVGNDNLFQSAVFANTVATLMGSQIEVLETTGAIGAARAAGVAVGAYADLREAVSGLSLVEQYVPLSNDEPYHAAYQKWQADLDHSLKMNSKK